MKAALASILGCLIAAACRPCGCGPSEDQLARIAGLRAKVKDVRFEVAVSVDSGRASGDLGVTATVSKVVEYVDAAGRDSLSVSEPAPPGQTVGFSCAGCPPGGFAPARARTNGAGTAGAVFSPKEKRAAYEGRVTIMASYKGRYTGRCSLR